MIQCLEERDPSINHTQPMCTVSSGSLRAPSYEFGSSILRLEFALTILKLTLCGYKDHSRHKDVTKDVVETS